MPRMPIMRPREKSENPIFTQRDHSAEKSHHQQHYSTPQCIKSRYHDERIHCYILFLFMIDGAVRWGYLSKAPLPPQSFRQVLLLSDRIYSSTAPRESADHRALSHLELYPVLDHPLTVESWNAFLYYFGSTNTRFGDVSKTHFIGVMLEYFVIKTNTSVGCTLEVTTALFPSFCNLPSFFSDLFLLELCHASVNGLMRQARHAKKSRWC
jgi:hypothetical protein